MIFNVLDNGSKIECNLTSDELELVKTSPESFKLYLEYQARIREEILNDFNKQREADIEERKYQRELAYKREVLQAEENKLFKEYDERRRKDAWSITISLDAAAIDAFCNKYENEMSAQAQIPPSSPQTK